MKQLGERLIDAQTQLAETKKTFSGIQKANVEVGGCRSLVVSAR